MSDDATLLRTKLLLLAGTLALLLVATLVGALLKRRLVPGRDPAGIDNLNRRIQAWWAMVLLLAAALLAGPTTTALLFAFLSFAALREFMTLAVADAGDHTAMAATFYVVLPLQYVLVRIGGPMAFMVFVPVVGFVLLPVIACAAADRGRFLERVATLQWGLMACVYCLSHVPALLLLDIPGFEGADVLLVAWLVIVVQCSDVLQYLFGKWLGRHPLAPVLSPGKTIEGLLGGVVAATALGAALYPITPFMPAQSALIAFVVCMVGVGGGLVMSAIKRDRGVKDWGRAIAGHGGVLDRIDSLLFAAPVFFHVVRHWWAR